MRYWIVLCLLGTFAIASAVELPEGVKMHRLQAGTRDKDGWYEAKSTEGHFTVSLPIPFNDFTVNVKEDGKEKISYVVGSKSKEGFKFTVTECPQESLAKPFGLKGTVEGFKSDKRSTVSEEKTFEFDGHPAFSFKVADTKSSAFIHAVSANSRVFMLIVEYPTALEKDVLPLTDPFFTSLKIDGK